MGSDLKTIKNSLDQQIKRFAASTYLVAVSGGLDSMLLLHLLYELGAPVQALHVNYRLRHHESELDAQLIAAYCTSQNIPLHLYAVTDTEQKTLKSSNLQAKARKIRYAFFDEISNSFPNSLICTAHHADDQVETFFLQLSRGAGMKGLAGMATLDQNRLRPFLNFSKQDLFRAANEVQLNWREDRSNQSLAYRRNVWRNQFLPELTELVPDLKNSVLQIQSTFQSEIKSQHKKLNFAIEQLKINQSITLKEISLLSVYQFIELFKYFQIPGHVIQRIPELFKAENGKKLTWNDLESKAYALLIFEKKLWYIRHHTVNEKQSCPFYFELEKVRQLPQTYHLEDIYLDTQLLEGALQLKPLKKADHLYPMGLKGKKNAFEILKEHKIPDLLRPMFWGLFDQDKLILMPGIKLDRRALATTNSTEILKVSLYKKT